jgi:glucoamylase
MYILMFRNVASDGFTFTDPQAPGDASRNSKPGCILAAPSFPGETPGIDQDYVFNWVRDGAITAMELVAAKMPVRPGGGVEPLNDYVAFAELCRSNATPTPGHACFTIAGQSRPWTEQNDGPALQSVAVMAAYPQLDAASKKVAVGLVNANVQFLLGVYKDPTTNLWEEHHGYSFFARSAQLRCFQEVSTTDIAGINKPPALKSAIDWLQNALAGHWDDANHRYVSMLVQDGVPSTPVVPGYDPNIDIVQACIYGAVPCTDPKMLSTAAQLRQQWEEGGIAFYPINAADKKLGMGPMFGRYPGDVYDGDTSDAKLGGHPWALSTCNVAELHYRLAAQITSSGKGTVGEVVAIDDLTAPFFADSGVTAATSSAEAATRLVATGDAMMQAVVYHSDNLELSEQFDGTSGFEKSVDNLTWSYAAFLSAARARTATHAAG